MSLKEKLRVQLEAWKAGELHFSQSKLLSCLLSRIAKAHEHGDWIENGFPGLRNMEIKDCLAYLMVKKVRSNKYLTPDDLEPGMYVIMLQSRLMSPSFYGQSFKVAAIDLPFVLLEPAVVSLCNFELLTTEVGNLALMRSSEDFFNKQREGTQNLRKNLGIARPGYGPEM